MAAPNIVGVTTIVGVSTFLSLGNTTPNVLVNNPASSDYVYKINSIIVANDGTATGKITVRIHNAAAGAGVSFNLANNVGVASETTLVVLDKASSIYLEENESITVQASASNTFDVVCSYETIID
jgi:hypothetical protein